MQQIVVVNRIGRFDGCNRVQVRQASADDTGEAENSAVSRSQPEAKSMWPSSSSFTILTEYLAQWTTDHVGEEGGKVWPKDKKLKLTLTAGNVAYFYDPTLGR